MMFTKFFIVFFTCFILQTSCVPLNVSKGDDDSNAILVVPTAAMKIIEAFVSFVTDSGISGIGKLNDAMSSIEGAFYEIQKAIVDIIWDVAVLTLNEKLTNATDFEKATIQCVLEQGDNYKAVVLDFASASFTCETQKDLKIINTYVPILTDIGNTNEDMKNLTEQLSNCGNDETAIKCIDEVSEKMEGELTDLGNVLERDIEDASKIKDDSSGVATLCLEDVKAKFDAVSQTITEGMSKCIQDKLNITSV